MYGHIWVGEYCNEKTINYIIKYVTKVDEDHKNYKSIILTSKGIGSNYIKTHAAKQNRYNEETTPQPTTPQPTSEPTTPQPTTPQPTAEPTTPQPTTPQPTSEPTTPIR